MIDLSNKISGLCFAAILAVIAYFIAKHCSLPVMLVALLLGMAGHLVLVETKTSIFDAGINFSAKKILRLGIILLGFRMSFGEIASLGTPTFAFIFALVFGSIGLGVLLVTIFKKPLGTGILSGGAVGICGASAAVAIAAVCGDKRISQQQVGMVILGVTLWGTVGMIGLPYILPMMGLSDAQQAFVIGASIHDVAQVTGAGYMVSEPVGDMATLVKLIRVVALVPVLLVLSMIFAARDSGSKIMQNMPWFVLAFCAVAGLNQFIPDAVSTQIAPYSKYCLILAITALGLRTDIREAIKIGAMPLLVIFIESAAVFGFALMGAHMLDLSLL